VEEIDLSEQESMHEPTRATVPTRLKDRSALFNKARLLDRISQAKLDAVIASSPVTITYVGGAFFTASPPYTGYVVTRSDGEQIAITVENWAEVQMDGSWIDDVRSFSFGPRSPEFALGLLVNSLKDLGVDSGRVGVEEDDLSIGQARALTRATNAEFIDAGAVFRETRWVKTPSEIDILRIAASNTKASIPVAFDRIHAGSTDKDLATALLQAMLDAGADGVRWACANGGNRSTLFSYLPGDDEIIEGDLISCDVGAVFDGYIADLGGSAVIGEPTSRQATIFGQLMDIQAELVASVRPGLPARDLFVLWKRLFGEAGLGDPSFCGIIGHNVGLSPHEGIELADDAVEVLEPGMVLCIEPGYYEGGFFHTEDMVLVTESGYELLSTDHLERTLHVIDRN
jgi:Xaa-Pro aminopeptidase